MSEGFIERWITNKKKGRLRSAFLCLWGCDIMRWGLFTCPYQRMPLESAFADASAFGYDYIELWGGRPHAYPPDLLRGESETVRRLAEKYEIPVEIYTPEHNAYPFNYMMGTHRQWEDAMDYLACAIRCGKDLGVAYVLISMGHSGFLPYSERKKRLICSLEYLRREAEALEQPVVLETLTPFESDTCTHPEELADVLDRISSPLLFGMCDVVVPFVIGEDPLNYARVLGNRLVHLHLADSNGVDETHLIFGEGRMKAEKILRDFQAAGYNSRATLELVTHYIDDPSGAAERILKKAKEFQL